LSGPLIKVVSDHSIGLLKAVGHSYTTLEPRIIMGELSVPIVPSTVRMVLACTALQGMAVAGSFILLGWESWKRKAAVLGLVLVPTYLVNLGRNALVIHLCDVQGMTFNLAHGVIGKSISLVTLVVLVVVAFILLPSLYENIVGVMDLPWRRGPNHQYKDRVFGTTFTKEEPTDEEPI
ncbi:MAG: exosortase/archaeosortase family protein, partial [Methanobacteriota archaeon]